MKNIGIIKTSVLAVLTTLLLVGCNNEELEKNSIEQPCDYICFVSSDKGVQKSGNANEYTANRFVLRSKNSKDTLCVRTIVSDGINVSNNSERRRFTRGTPVTGINNFYDKFHVLAYIDKPSGLSNFFMNQNATNDGEGTWRTDILYYWPGSDYQFSFYAWAPIDAKGLTPPTKPDTKELKYTVPDAAADQKDILVAKYENVPGDKNTTLALNFKHILSAVKFVVGSQMQPGTIKSVAIKGVKNSGTYDMSSGIWTLANDTKNFTQTLNYNTTGSETDGTNIIAGEATFMMLPQTLGATAQVEVVFVRPDNTERTLTASISGQEWPMGKTVTYKLSITPEYELEFVNPPTEVDAHYDIIPIKVKADKITGNWIIKSNQDWVTIKSALTTYEKNGYWLKKSEAYSSYCSSESVPVEREKTLTKTSSGEVELYLFFEENNSTADRTVTLTLNTGGKDVTTIDIVQKCPQWIGNIGWEVIEENLTLPYGFKWDRKVTYKRAFSGFGATVAAAFSAWLSKWVFVASDNTNFLNPKTVKYVNVSRDGGTVRVTIDYKEMSDVVTSALATDNGLLNTWNLHSGVGFTTFDGEQDLLDRGYDVESETGSNEATNNFAALYAIKLNAFDIVVREDLTNTTYVVSPEEADIKWYLPASGEFSGVTGLNGQYWTSTAINDHENAYSWNVSVLSTPRMDLHKVRAVRNK